MKTQPFIIHRRPDGDWDRFDLDLRSHESVTFKMPENLERHNWPCIPALRRTRLEFLTTAQMRALMVHAHGEEFTAVHFKARQDYWWWRMCEAIGSPNVSGISTERAQECLKIDNTILA